MKTAAGSEYAEYTYAPSDRILNGFIQAVIGLYDYTQITNDPLGLKLFEAGDAEARAEVPHYDTGAWSLYDQYSESNLNYHELLTEFLQHLCERTRKGPPIEHRAGADPDDAHHDHAAAAHDSDDDHADDALRRRRLREPARRRARRAPGTAATSTTPRRRRSRAIRSTARRPRNFTTYLKTPPVISLITKTLKGGTARACSCRCRRSRPCA